MTCGPLCALQESNVSGQLKAVPGGTMDFPSPPASTFRSGQQAQLVCSFSLQALLEKHSSCQITLEEQKKQSPNVSFSPPPPCVRDDLSIWQTVRLLLFNSRQQPLSLMFHPVVNYSIRSATANSFPHKNSTICITKIQCQIHIMTNSMSLYLSNQTECITQMLQAYRTRFTLAVYFTIYYHTSPPLPPKKINLYTHDCISYVILTMQS